MQVLILFPLKGKGKVVKLQVLSTFPICNKHKNLVMQRGKLTQFRHPLHLQKYTLLKHVG